MPVLDPTALIENRVTAITLFHEDVGIQRAQLDVSGGLDSAVVLGLLAKALGAANITAVHSQIDSNPVALERAREVCDVFGVKLIEIDLTKIYTDLVGEMEDAYLDALSQTVVDPWWGEPGSISGEPQWKRYRELRPGLAQALYDDPTILGSIRSTLRAPVGRGFNRLAGGGIRHGTGNECEDRWIRFYQKGGDGEVDTNPVAMLSKAETYQLGLALGVPKSILSAIPSPDLWSNGDEHNDEDEIGDYLGIKASEHGQTFYGYIDPVTGAYTKVGLIERVSRFLDLRARPMPISTPPGTSFGDILFQDISDDTVDFIVRSACSAEPFKGINPDLVHALLVATRKVEAATRHKFNPNCPTLGERAGLVKAGILTDDLGYSFRGTVAGAPAAHL